MQNAEASSKFIAQEFVNNASVPVIPNAGSSVKVARKIDDRRGARTTASPALRRHVAETAENFVLVHLPFSDLVQNSFAGPSQRGRAVHVVFSVDRDTCERLSSIAARTGDGAE
jgi:hypothetical protein